MTKTEKNHPILGPYTAVDLGHAFYLSFSSNDLDQLYNFVSGLDIQRLYKLGMNLQRIHEGTLDSCHNRVGEYSLKVNQSEGAVLTEKSTPSSRGRSASQSHVVGKWTFPIETVHAMIRTVISDVSEWNRGG